MLAVLHSTFVPQDKSIGSSLNKCITHSRRKCKHFSSNTTFKNSTIYTKYVCFSCSVVSDSWDPIDCSPPGSSVHGILQTRILECTAIPSPGDLPNPGIKPGSPALQADYLLSYEGSTEYPKSQNGGGTQRWRRSNSTWKVADQKGRLDVHKQEIFADQHFWGFEDIFQLGDSRRWKWGWPPRRFKPLGKELMAATH